jgi:hypothetical protein
MANATYQLSVTGTHYNQFVENVMCFQGDTADGTQTLAEGQDLIDSFVSAIVPSWLACLPPTYTLDRLSTRCVVPSGPSNVAHSQVINSALIGTFGTGAVSENLCPAVNLIPPMGIKTQGRVYMPCIAKTAIDNNQFVTGYRTAVNSVFGLMRIGFSISAITWKLAIFSKKNGTSSLCLASSLSAAIGFQGRRRKPL